MNENEMNGQMKLSGVQSVQVSDGLSLAEKIDRFINQMEFERRIAQLRKQQEQDKENELLSSVGKGNDTSTVHSTEIPDVDKMISKDHLNFTDRFPENKKRFDTYERQPESQTIGIYEPFYDDGKLVIQYDHTPNEPEEKTPHSDSENSE